MTSSSRRRRLAPDVVDREPSDLLEVPNVPGDHRQSMSQRGGRDLEVGLRDRRACALERRARLAVHPGHVRIERQDREPGQHLLLDHREEVTLALRSIRPLEQLAHHDGTRVLLVSTDFGQPPEVLPRRLLPPDLGDRVRVEQIRHHSNSLTDRGSPRCATALSSSFTRPAIPVCFRSSRREPFARFCRCALTTARSSADTTPATTRPCRVITTTSPASASRTYSANRAFASATDTCFLMAAPMVIMTISGPTRRRQRLRARGAPTAGCRVAASCHGKKQLQLTSVVTPCRSRADARYAD